MVHVEIASHKEGQVYITKTETNMGKESIIVDFRYVYFKCVLLISLP